jgi:hypothetical protein
MYRAKFVIGAAAWLSMLMLQLSGLHTHANENGYVGVPETASSHTHSHHQHADADLSGAFVAQQSAHSGDHDIHEHEDVRDISFFELASGAFKLPLAILALILLFSFYPHTRSFYRRASLAHPVHSGRHTRWRPPLRAPPQHVSI